MGKPAELEKLTGVAARFGAFVAERHPFALEVALAAFEAAAGGRDPKDEAGFEALRGRFRVELTKRLSAVAIPDGLAETTPQVSAATRIGSAHRDLADDCDGFLRRQSLAASLTADERLEILRGMILTRAT